MSIDKWHYAFLSMFVAAAFGFIFANAWNNLSLTMLKTYERKDETTGQVIHPVRQSFYYALAISALCALLLWFFYEKIGIRKK